MDHHFFINNLYKHNIITKFLDVFESNVEMSKKLDYVTDFCNIFFTIRIHHKCRTILEAHKKAKKN